MIRHFGIEMEFSEDYYCHLEQYYEFFKPIIVKNSIHEIKINEKSVTKNITDKWFIKPDSSCGLEIITPKLEITDQNIKMVSKVLDEFKGVIEKEDGLDKVLKKNCGFHVHFETKNIFQESKARKYLDIWRKLESPLFSVHCKSRFINAHIDRLQEQYKRTKKITFDIIDNKYSSTNRVDNNHFEARHALSTLNKKDIENWIYLVLIFSEIAELLVFDTKQEIVDRKKSINGHYLITLLKNYKSKMTTKWLKDYTPQVIKWIIEKNEIYWNNII